MPQLDKVTFLSQFFWLCFFFLGFYYILLKFYLPKVSRILALRRKKMGYQGILSFREENHQVRENYHLFVSKAFSTTQTLFNSLCSRTLNWVDNSAKKISKTHYQKANDFYFNSLAESALSQNVQFYHATPDQEFPETLFFKSLLNTLKIQKSQKSTENLEPTKKMVKK